MARCDDTRLEEVEAILLELERSLQEEESGRALAVGFPKKCRMCPFAQDVDRSSFTAELHPPSN